MTKRKQAKLDKIKAKIKNLTDEQLTEKVSIIDHTLTSLVITGVAGLCFGALVGIIFLNILENIIPLWIAAAFLLLSTPVFVVAGIYALCKRFSYAIYKQELENRQKQNELEHTENLAEKSNQDTKDLSKTYQSTVAADYCNADKQVTPNPTEKVVYKKPKTKEKIEQKNNSEMQ